MDIHEYEQLDQQANQGKSHEEAIPVIEDYKKIIRSKKKGKFLKDLKTQKDLEIC